ncbi:NMCC_0638 family (lipo)protein [Pseudomonas sp. LB3P31]
MRKLFITTLLLALASNSCWASEGEDQTASFFKIYSSLCLKNIHKFEALKETLKPMPKLPPEKAEPFLAGQAGDAWPVPDEHATAVLAILSGNSLCAVYVRRADTAAAIKLFTSTVATAPSPIKVKLLKSETMETVLNGQTQTVSYEWSAPNAKRGILFTLTTASADFAHIQVLGSVAVVGLHDSPSLTSEPDTPDASAPATHPYPATTD